MAKILIVEDDHHVSQTITDWATSVHHCVESVFSGPDGLDRLKFYAYDLAILDWQLPGLTGVEICRQYRRTGGTIPILMLTGQRAIENKEEGFDSGADDYLTKPFELRELAARVQALLRRPSQIVKALQKGQDLSLDYQTFSLVRSGQKVRLLPKEFAILEFLLRHPGQYFTPEQILNHVWGSDSESTIDSLRTCIKRLRQRIDVGDNPAMIVTSRGFGYKLELPVALPDSD